ncbi:MAG TPA: hypothetical protein PK413_20620 [Thermoanaerobaculia bacterium]|nr:hypothetical protein [Thermoanaerobaculia bacterium]
MSTKTISLSLPAYERLRSARQRPEESFSQVILRARWPEQPITAGEFLKLVRQRGPLLSEEGIREIEELKRRDAPPEDKWRQP